MQLANKCVAVNNFGPVMQFDNQFYQMVNAEAGDLTLVSTTSIVPRLQHMEEKMMAAERLMGILMTRLNRVEAESAAERQAVTARMATADQNSLQLAQQVKSVAEAVDSKGKQIVLQQQQLNLLCTEHMDLKRFTEEYVCAVTPSGDAGSEAPPDIFISMQNEDPEEANSVRQAQDLFPPPPPPCMSIENMLRGWDDDENAFL
jgi:hypothetical protein